jgi:hypothetical protein
MQDHAAAFFPKKAEKMRDFPALFHFYFASALNIYYDSLTYTILILL